MNSGVPRIWPSSLRWGAMAVAAARTRPKSSSLATSSIPPAPRGEDVRRLDVAVDQARRVRLAQRLADLPQQVDRPPGRQGAVALDQLGQAQARQVFHDVVVGPVLGAAVVVDLDGVRVRERGRQADLALEPRQGLSDRSRCPAGSA